MEIKCNKNLRDCVRTYSCIPQHVYSPNKIAKCKLGILITNEAKKLHAILDTYIVQYQD